jgi:hypothetical protein
MKYVRPRCLAASGSDRNSPKPRSAYVARVLHVFWPDKSHPPSVRTAVLRRLARSLPASGSDHACAQISSARAMGGRTRASCSGVPCANSVGASRKMPFWLTRNGARAAKYSSSNTTHCSKDASRPPSSRGHDTTDRRASASVCSHARCASKPAAVSIDGNGGSGARSARNARTSSRNARVSASRSRSIRTVLSSTSRPCRRASPCRPRRCARARSGAARTPSPCRCACPSRPRTGSPRAW